MLCISILYKFSQLLCRGLLFNLSVSLFLISYIIFNGYFPVLFQAFIVILVRYL